MGRMQALAVLLLWAPSVAAQGIERLERGDSVRLTAPLLADTVILGEVYHVDSDAILITQRDTMALRTIHFRDIQTLERQVKGGTAGGALGGFVGGAALGAGIATVAVGGVGEEYEGLGAILVIGGAGILGAVVGYVAGVALTWDRRWYELELPARPMVAVHPTGRFSLGVSIPLRP